MNVSIEQPVDTSTSPITMPPGLQGFTLGALIMAALWLSINQAWDLLQKSVAARQAQQTLRDQTEQKKRESEIQIAEDIAGDYLSNKREIVQSVVEQQRLLIDRQINRTNEILNNMENSMLQLSTTQTTIAEAIKFQSEQHRHDSAEIRALLKTVVSGTNENFLSAFNTQTRMYVEVLRGQERISADSGRVEQKIDRLHTRLDKHFERDQD